MYNYQERGILTKSIGSKVVPYPTPYIVWKCKCGPVDTPVEPTSPIFCPRCTICPDLTDTGIGIAPIGHKVTVTTVTETVINISSKITLSETGELTTVTQQIQQALETYFLNLRKTWEDNSSLIVRKSQIETTILSIEGVIDISETKLNNSDSNIEVSMENIPVLGEVDIYE